MAAPLVALALDYYRDPLAYRHLAEVEHPLPRGFSALLAEFCSALSSARIAQTAAQLMVEQDEMEEAARFFVRHVLLSPTGDFYRHLGLNRDVPQESIRHHYQLLIRMFHPDRVDASTEVGAFYATRINLAYQTLGDPETRAAYDRGLPELAVGFTETDPAWFFRPSLPVLAGKRSGRAPRGRGARGRPRRVGVILVGAVMLGALVLGSGYALIQSNQKPTLRLAASGSGETSAPLPSYLAPSARMSGSGDRTAVDPLPPIEPTPVDNALSEQDRTGIRAVEDAPVHLAAVTAGVSVSPTAPPTPTRIVAPSATANSVTPEKTIDAGRLRVGQVEVGRFESGRVVRALPHEDLAKAREPEALVIPPVAAAAASASLAGDVPPPKAIEPERPAEPTRLSTAPTRAVDAAPRRPETDTAIAPKAQPATPPKAESPELPKMQPKAQSPELPKMQPKAQSRVEPAPQPKTAPKAIPPAPPVKPASRRAEEQQADRLAPKSAAVAPTPAAPAQPARSVAAAAERAPSVAPSRPAATPEQDASALIARLESTYAAMNAGGFAALFTANARVNEGSGRGLIRSKYGDLFKRTTGAKLSISNMRWRVMSDGRISGSGAISVGNQYRGGGRWQYRTGRIDFELVREGQGYRIASMIYRLN